MEPATPEIDRRLAAACESDPRVNEKYVHHIDVTDPEIVLVGVVHDHPASIHRVEAIIDVLEPGTVAVELPDLLVSSFAAAVETGDGVGGEMATAIRAADTTPVVGIDVPSRGTASSLATVLSAHRPGFTTTLRTLRSIGKMFGHAALGRLAHLGVPGLPAIRDLEHKQVYDIPDAAPAGVQAEHEATHLGRGTTLLRAFEPPPATRLMDAVREQHMADRLGTINGEDPVVAVVGYSHLDGIAAVLQKEFE